MSYKEPRERDALPGQTETLESKQGEIEVNINHSDFYKTEQDGMQITLTPGYYHRGIR